MLFYKRKPDKKKYYDEIKSTYTPQKINSEIRSIAKKYNFNLPRFKKLFSHLINDPIAFDMAIYRWDEWISEAITYLGREKTIELFENEGMENVKNKIDNFGALNRNLYKISEEGLLFITKNYIDYLINNRELLIETGYPRKPIQKFIRFHQPLVYPVRLPKDIDLYEIQDVIQFYIYSWDNSYKKINKFQTVYKLWKQTKITRIYNDTPLLKGLNPIDAERIECNRAKLIDLKIEVLDSIYQNKITENAWENVIKILTKHLLSDDIDFYLKMEIFYEQCNNIVCHLIINHITSGWLTDLILYISEFEHRQEFKLNTNIIKILEKFIVKNPDNSPRFEFDSYCQILNNKNTKDIFDQALDIFETTKIEYVKFLSVYKTKVFDSLKNDFDVIVPIRYKRKFQPLFQPHIHEIQESIDNIQNDNIELERKITSLTPISTLKRIPSATEHQKSSETTSFSPSADYRCITYKGIIYTLTPMQAQVIQLLHEAYKSGHPFLGKDYILEEIGTTGKRLGDIFKSNKEVWREVILKRTDTKSIRRGMYRLNI